MASESHERYRIPDMQLRAVSHIRLSIKGVPKSGVPFPGSHDKDYGILGSILGRAIHGNYRTH